MVTTQCKYQVNILHWRDCIMQMLHNLVKWSSNIEQDIGNPKTNYYVIFRNTTDPLSNSGPVCNFPQACCHLCMLSYSLNVIYCDQATIHHTNYFCQLCCLDFPSHIHSTIECDLSSLLPGWTSTPQTLQMLY